jgi:hypothetical protein
MLRPSPDIVDTVVENYIAMPAPACAMPGVADDLSGFPWRGCQPSRPTIKASQIRWHRTVQPSLIGGRQQLGKRKIDARSRDSHRTLGLYSRVGGSHRQSGRQNRHQ